MTPFATRFSRLGLTFGIALLLLSPIHADTDRPNIVFMLSDDQAWNGLSVTMHEQVPGSKSDFYRTPSLEKLAAQGMRFSAAYAPAPKCAPTRCSLQAGKSPAQNHLTLGSRSVTAADGYKLIPPQDIRNLPTREKTIGELLRAAGYATAHYGKWHLGGGGPGSHGYDDHDGDIGNEYAYEFGDPNPVDIFGMARRADAFMQKHTKAGKPFLIQMSWHALHAPHNALKATLQDYRVRQPGRMHSDVERAAITENLDTGVGMVMKTIDRLGIGDNTFLIYMSDNGHSGGRRGPLNGGKSSLWEGGIRVPLIVRGPGIEANSWCHTSVVGYDLFPTFCEWAGVRDLPEGIEGGSLVSLLMNSGKGTINRPREALVFHMPQYHSGDGPHSAILLGNLKLMRFYETNRLALFDLSRNIGERNDLAEKLPAEAQKLNALLTEHLAAVGADLPVVNPNHDPTKTPLSRREAKRNRQGDGKKGKARRGGRDRRGSEE